VIFTDDDLKQLKDSMRLSTTVMDSQDLEALLARLEAAESCIDNPHHFSHHYPENHCKGCIAIQAWHRAAGK
jgi:hypothetical protein